MLIHKLSISELKKQLKWHSILANNKTKIQAITNSIWLKLNKEDNRLEVYSTNLNLVLKSSVTIFSDDINEKIDCIVPISFIENSIKLLDPKGCLSIIQTENPDYELILSTNYDTTKQKYIDSEYFPSIPENNVIGEKSFKIVLHTQEQLFTSLKFVGGEEKDIYKHVVKLSSDNKIENLNKTFIASTNAKKCYFNSNNEDNFKENIVLLRAETIKLLERINIKNEYYVINSNGMNFIELNDNISIIETVYEGRYPQPEITISKRYVYTKLMIFNNSELKEVLDNLIKISKNDFDKREKKVVMQITLTKPDKAIFTVKSSCAEYYKTINCIHNEENDFVFGVDAKLFRECLVKNDKDVIISYRNITEPLRILTADAEVIALMPLRLDVRE